MVLRKTGDDRKPQVKCEVHVTCKFTVTVVEHDERVSIESIRQSAQIRASSLVSDALVAHLPTTVVLRDKAIRAVAHKVIADDNDI